MKKITQLMGLLIVMIMLFVLIGTFQAQRASLTINESKEIAISISEGTKENTVKLWKNPDDEKYYFFMPSFIRTKLRIGEIGGVQGTWNGQRIYKYMDISWEPGVTNTLTLDNVVDESLGTYEIVFLQSSEIPAIFIESEIGNMEFIHENKENEEKGDIEIFLPDGGKYSGGLERISMRGNSTASYPKKPYAIKLDEAVSLCGIGSASKRWNLLAGWREGNKMNSKIAYDIANYLEESKNVDTAWVDLYLNGEYAGIYLLCEAISVGNVGINIHDLEKDNQKQNDNIDSAKTSEVEAMKGYEIEDRPVIDGGYLVERDFFANWENENNGFITEGRQGFVIKEPKHASRAEVAYIKNIFCEIEKMTEEEDVKWGDYTDLKSLSRQFLVDEISLNFDAGFTSMFFYKDSGNDLIYLGPSWDYDTAFGTVPAVLGDYTIINNYEGSIFGWDRGVRNWYKAIYHSDDFKEEMMKQYSTLLPYIDYLLETGIDEYAELIRDSVYMEDVRWESLEKSTLGNAGHYQSFDANVAFLKFYLAKRMNCLNERWGVTYHTYEVPSNGEMHKVSFVVDNVVCAEYEVPDGQVMESLPDIDEELYSGWYFTHSNEEYNRLIPIYEDTSLEAKVKNTEE